MTLLFLLPLKVVVKKLSLRKGTWVSTALKACILTARFSSAKTEEKSIFSFIVHEGHLSAMQAGLTVPLKCLNLYTFHLLFCTAKLLN